MIAHREEVTPDEFSKKKKPVLLETKQSMKDLENVEGDGQQKAEDFYLLLSIYGNILKNAELLDNADKVQHLENYMYAMNILLGEIFALAETFKKEILFEDFIKKTRRRKRGNARRF